MFHSSLRVDLIKVCFVLSCCKVSCQLGWPPTWYTARGTLTSWSSVSTFQQLEFQACTFIVDPYLKSAFHRNMFISANTAILVTIAKIQGPPRGSSVDKLIKKMWYHTRGGTGILFSCKEWNYDIFRKIGGIVNITKDSEKQVLTFSSHMYNLYLKHIYIYI